MEQRAIRIVELLKEKYPERQTIVIDSLCASVGEGFLVAEALRMQANNPCFADMLSLLPGEVPYLKLLRHPGQLHIPV